MRALLVYHTITGHSKKAAEDVAQGLRKREVDINVKHAKEATSDDVQACDIIVISTPTHVFGPASIISHFFSRLDEGDLEGKRIALLTCYAGMGGSSTLRILNNLVRKKGASGEFSRLAIRCGSPLSLVPGPDASPDDVQRCIEIGEELGS